MLESLHATLSHGLPLKQRWIGMGFTKYGVSEGLLVPSLNLSYTLCLVISLASMKKDLFLPTFI